MADDETKVTAEGLRAQADELDKQAANEATKAEKKAAREAFMALSPEERAAVLKAKAHAEELERIKSNPSEEDLETTVGVDLMATNDYAYFTIHPHDLRSARLLIRGKNVEHVGEDPWGRWLYRRM